MDFTRSCYVAGRDRGLQFFRSAMEEYPLGGLVPCDTEDDEFSEGDEVTPEYWVSVAYDCESNSRQFSPWELVAHAINSSEEPSEGWEAYDEGVGQGVAIGLWLYNRGSQVPCRCIYGIPE